MNFKKIATGCFWIGLILIVTSTIILIIIDKFYPELALKISIMFYFVLEIIVHYLSKLFG